MAYLFFDFNLVLGMRQPEEIYCLRKKNIHDVKLSFATGNFSCFLPFSRFQRIQGGIKTFVSRVTLFLKWRLKEGLKKATTPMLKNTTR